VNGSRRVSTLEILRTECPPRSIDLYLFPRKENIRELLRQLNIRVF
jgi:hypothetical protein